MVESNSESNTAKETEASLPGIQLRLQRFSRLDGPDLILSVQEEEVEIGDLMPVPPASGLNLYAETAKITKEASCSGNIGIYVNKLSVGQKGALLSVAAKI